MSVTPFAVDGPALWTTRSKLIRPPLGTADSETVLVRARSASTVPGPVSVAWLFVRSLSPPPATTAVFSICAGGGSTTTALTTSGGYEAPGARGSPRSQWRVVVTVEGQDQPVPATSTEIDEKASDGNTSSSVTVPEVAIVPVFETMIVNGVGKPPTNSPVCVLVTVRSGASTSVVTSLLRDVSAVPRL